MVIQTITRPLPLKGNKKETFRLEMEYLNGYSDEIG
jgi:hypothetical protein